MKKGVGSEQKMSKRGADLSQSDLSPSVKKTKTSTHAILTLSSDEISLLIDYLQIGEVIMLSLVCKSFHETLSKHIKTIHPYCIKPSTYKRRYGETYFDGDDQPIPWSISRALKTHRCVVVSPSSFEEVGVILKEMIEEKEPLSKLTTSVELIDLDFEDAFELLATPTNNHVKDIPFINLINEDDNDPSTHETPKADTNLEIKSLKNAPIGFEIQKLEINMELSRSQLYKLLSQCHRVESLTLSVQQAYETVSISGGRGRGAHKKIPKHEETVSVPRLDSLKFLNMKSCFCYDAGQQFAYDIFKLAPNLEYLEFVYHTPVEDDLLIFLSKMCPKLKEIFIEGNDDSTPMEMEITDDALFQFMKGEPCLEYVRLTPCCQISGEIFSKMGQFKNLRYFSVDRTCLNGDMVGQYDNITFGGGVLDKLEVFEFGDQIDMESASEDAKKNFIDSFLKMAPNIKNMGSIPFTEGIDSKAAFEKLPTSLTIIPQSRHFTQPNEDTITQAFLEKCSLLGAQLEEVDIPANIDCSKIKTMPSVKKLSIYGKHADVAMLTELCRVFPCVEVFNCPEIRQKPLVDLLKGGAWPNLKRFASLSDDILEVRPFLVDDVGPFDEPKEIRKSSLVKDELVQFVKDWIVLDPIVVEQKESKMIRFMEKH